MDCHWQGKNSATAVMANLDIMTRMQELMRQIGDVETDGRQPGFFEVYSNRNVGAGVTVYDSREIKIVFLWDDAMSLPHRTLTAQRAILTVQHNGGSFRARVYKSRNPWRHGMAPLAVWKPAAIVDEELMRKAVSLVRNVFDAAN